MTISEIPRCCLASALLASTLASSPASSEPLLPLQQRVNLSAGVFMLDTNTRIRVDATNVDLGTEVNLEDTFGFDEQDRLRVEGYWRFATRHKVRFMYFNSRSASTRTIQETIEFKDRVFPVNAEVRAQFDTEIIEVAYDYAFIRHDSFELAGTIGLHNLEVNARLSGNATSNLGAGGVAASASATGDGPLPVIGIHALWAFSENFYLDAQAQFFTLELDEYDGSLQDFKVSVVWQPNKYVGVGLGYNDFVTRLKVDGDQFTGRLRFGYGGPIAFATVGF